MSKSIKIKEAKTERAVSDIIRMRWSARAFSDKEITKKSLYTLFEAASWAPSSMNEQPWRYFYVHRSNHVFFNQAVACMMEGNQPWAKHSSVIILSLAEKNFSENGAANRHCLHDTGSANTLLLLQAIEMDIYGHMIGGFHADKAIKLFNVPENLEPVCFITLGYLADPDKLDEPFKSRELTPRKRRVVNEFSFEF